MSKPVNRLSKAWVSWGIAPVLLLIVTYIVLDIYSADATRATRAALSLVAACLFVPLSLVAVFKLSGRHKLVPALGAILGIIAAAWFSFVLSFSITF